MKKLLNTIDRFYWKSGIADDVPAMTYFLLVSLLPFSLGILVVASLIFGDYLSTQSLLQTAGGILPLQAREFIAESAVSTKANSPWLLAFSVFAMAWTASGAIGIIERCSARINHSRRYPAFFGKLRNIAFGFLIAGAIVAGTAAIVVANGTAATLHLGSFWPKAIPFLHSIASILVCTFIFRYVTKDRIAWKDSFRGGIFSGIILQTSPYFISLYISNISASLENFFITLGVLVLICYLMSNCFLCGIGIAGKAWQIPQHENLLSSPYQSVLSNGSQKMRNWQQTLQWRIPQIIEKYHLKNLQPLVAKDKVLAKAIWQNQKVFLTLAFQKPKRWPQSSVVPKIIFFEDDLLIYEDLSNDKPVFRLTENFDITQHEAMTLLQTTKITKGTEPPLQPAFPNMWSSLYKMFPNDPSKIKHFVNQRNIWLPGIHFCVGDHNAYFVHPFAKSIPEGLFYALVIQQQTNKQSFLEKFPSANIWLDILPQLNLDTD